MNFFRRTKIFFRVLCAACIVIGISLFLQLLTNGVTDIFRNPEDYILLFFTLGLFIVLILIAVVLKCIISDATEDFNAAFKLYDNLTDKD